MAWLYRQGEHFQLAQNVADIILVGFNILMQAEAGAAAFNQNRRKSGAGSVVISTAGCQRAYHIFHIKYTRHRTGFLFYLGSRLAGIVNVRMQAFVDIAAVHVYIKISNREKVVAD